MSLQLRFNLEKTTAIKLAITAYLTLFQYRMPVKNYLDKYSLFTTIESVLFWFVMAFLVMRRVVACVWEQLRKCGLLGAQSHMKSVESTWIF